MTSLRVSDIFSSIQGESSFAGLPFTFIRLAGCNLNCSWCDTPQSRLFRGDIIPVDAVMDAVGQKGMQHVCVTGGEPLLQEACYALLGRLVDNSYITTLETNGTIDISNVPDGVIRIVDVKCPSSGMARFNRRENLAMLSSQDEVKFVIKDHEDYIFARSIFRRYLYKFAGPVFLSPVAGEIDPVHLANWVLSDKIPLRVHLQLHKILKLK